MRNPAHILMADDDRDDQLLFMEAIERSCSGCFCVQSVNNGVELMQRLHDPSGEVPDIIVLDINMPLKDGLAALREIRSESRYRDVFIFILSTSSRPDDVKLCKELGCDQYYTKPYHLAEYNRIVADMISRTASVVH